MCTFHIILRKLTAILLATLGDRVFDEFLLQEQVSGVGDVCEDDLDVGIHPPAAVRRGDALGSKFAFSLQSRLPIKEVLEDAADDGSFFWLDDQLVAFPAVTVNAEVAVRYALFHALANSPFYIVARDKLESDYFKTHAEFVTNPLLLTLMLMSYHRFADVPEKKYLFYEQAYQTLLQRHDSDKLAYKRVFQSVTDPSDFTLVFREFCAKSYRKGDYEFSRNKFDSYFGKLRATGRLDPELMKADAFLFDACNSACLMYEEGQSYHFLHRSFQEYFFADYYSREDDTTLIKLGNYIRTSDQMLFDEGSAFEMLFDLAPEKVERFIIMPYLALIFDEGTRKQQYWKFLRDGYNGWMYTMLDDEVISQYKEKYDIRERYPRFRNNVEPESAILSLVLRLLNQEYSFAMEPEGPKFKYPQIVTESLYGELIRHDEAGSFVMPLFHIPKQMLEDEEVMKDTNFLQRLVLDENKKPVELGHIYFFPFGEALSNPELFPEVIELWERDACPAKKIFNHVEHYYKTLQEKYAHVDEMDDDDF